MSSVTLSEFMAFNEELAALIRAGIPLNVEFAQSAAHAESTLQKINAEVARQVSHGASVQQALDVPSEAIPPRIVLAARGD